MSKFAPTPGQAPVIADLIDRRQRLEVWCCRCHRCEQIPPERAIELLGADTTFPRAEERLTCATCGARGRDRWILARPSVEDFYANLEGLGGLTLPGRVRDVPAQTNSGPDEPNPRRSHPRRRRSRAWRG